MKRKILFFNQSREIGGTDTFLINLIKEWPNKSDELWMLHNSDHKGAPLYSDLTVNNDLVYFPSLQRIRGKIGRLPVPGLIKYIIRALIYVLRPVIFSLQIAYLYIKIKKNDYNVLFSNNGGYPAGELCLAMVIAAKIARIEKIFLIIHNDATRPKFPFVWWEYSIIDKLVAGACDEIITVSKSCAQQIENNRKLNREIMVINNGLPIAKKDSCTLKQKRDNLGLSATAKTIGAIGDYEERKGHKYLIMAFEQAKIKHPNLKLVIIGSAAFPYARNLKAMVDASRYKEDIRLTGYLPNAAEYLECFDVLVLPSIAFESFGLSLLEAMLYRKPVIGTLIGGIPEVIGDAGYIVEPKNSEQLAEKINYLLENPGVANALGEKGFKRLHDNFSVQVMAEKYYALCRSGQ